MNKIAWALRLALIVGSFGVSGCSNAATDACSSARSYGPAPGAAPGSPTECQVCCEREGSYQAANNTVEPTCECN